MKIAHIINPAKVARSSDLFFTQPITFETIKIAKEFTSSDIGVGLYSAQFEEDMKFVPHFFNKTKHLDRSVLDLANFKINRKLPILKDILDRLFEASDAAYFIYTNVDICLMPNFYSTLYQIILKGYDACVINRRTIPDTYQQLDEIPFMFAEIGEPHIGHDCFIFRREIYPQFKLGEVCVGVRLVGRVLLWNLLAHSEKFKEFKNLHLTFHIGSNKPWKHPDLKDYAKFNELEARRVLQLLDHEQDFIRLLHEKYPDYLITVNQI